MDGGMRGWAVGRISPVDVGLHCAAEGAGLNGIGTGCPDDGLGLQVPGTWEGEAPWGSDLREEWADAIKWYLAWLDACAEAGADHRSLAERLRSAVHSAGARRGLARRTKQCYGAWAAKYAVFSGTEREVMKVETATRFLTSVVDDEDCAYSTQKQALNALAHFFKCGFD